LWGRDLPEFLIQVPHARFQGAEGALRTFRQAMVARYPAIYQQGLPHLAQEPDRPFAFIRQQLPFTNQSASLGNRHLLLLLPLLDVGGVSSFALAMLEQLTAQGYHCSVCATLPGQNPLLRAFERYADVFILSHFLQRPAIPQFLSYLVRSRQIDVVLLSNSLLGYRLLPYLRATCPGCTFVDYNHMRDPACANQGNPGFSVEYHELLDFHIVSSQELRTWMTDHATPPDRSAVLYTSADTERWQPDPLRQHQIRQEFGVPDGVPLLVYTARLTAQKQPRVLAQVLLNLVNRGLTFHCIVAGDGPDLGWLRRYIHNKGLSTIVHLIGAVDQDRMVSLMAAADILFLPSAYEGLALVLYEAMASGTVPVSVDSGGQGEVVTPDCGILITPDEHQEAHYTAALEWLIRAPRQRQAMAEAGRKRMIERFSNEQMGIRLEQLLQTAQALCREQPQPLVNHGAGLVAASMAIEELRHYERNHRFRSVLAAWTWWKHYGERYTSSLRYTYEWLVRRSTSTYRVLWPWRRSAR